MTSRRPRLGLTSALILLACSREPTTGSLESTLSVLPEALRPFYASDLRLEGSWIANWIPGRDSTHMEISCLESRKVYRLILCRSTASATASYETLAYWKDGGLWPQGTDATTRGHLYPARIEGRDCLVPSESLELLSGGSLWGEKEEHAFRRVRGASRPDPESPLEVLPGGTVVEPLPAGTWEAVDGSEWAWLEIRPTGVPGVHRVRCSRRLGEDPTPVHTFVRGTWGAGELALDSPLFGSASWCIRRVGEEDWLVPGATIGAEEEPEGVRFRLVSRATRTEGPLWGPMDFPDEDSLEMYRNF